MFALPSSSARAIIRPLQRLVRMIVYSLPILSVNPIVLHILSNPTKINGAYCPSNAWKSTYARQSKRRLFLYERLLTKLINGRRRCHKLLHTLRRMRGME
jgi:hypothetical protein